MRENLLPALTSPVWTAFSPAENKRPAFSAAQDALTIRAAAFSDCGKWQCVFPVEPGQCYEVSAEVGVARVAVLSASVRVMVHWFSADDVFLRSDYLTAPAPLPDGGFRFSRRLTAPQGKPYSADATSARLELLFWNSDDGEAVFRALSVTPAETRPHRRVRVVTTFLSPYAEDGRTREGRLEKLCRSAERAGALSPDIVCFAEGIADRELGLPLAEVSEPVPGPLTERMADFARRYHTYILFNLHEVEDGFFYNTSVLLDRQGGIAGRYRKVHLTLRECDRGLTPGREFPVFETDFGRVGSVVCFDHFYPESVRQLAAAGAELVLIPTAGDAGVVGQARAMDNGIPVCIAGVNRSAASPWPQSRIFGADGVFLAGTGEDESAAVATIDLDAPPLSFWFSVGPAYARRHDIFLAESRPDTYRL